VPFAILARRTNAVSDAISTDQPEQPLGVGVPGDTVAEVAASEAVD